MTVMKIKINDCKVNGFLPRLFSIRPSVKVYTCLGEEKNLRYVTKASKTILDLPKWNEEFLLEFPISEEYISFVIQGTFGNVLGEAKVYVRVPRSQNMIAQVFTKKGKLAAHMKLSFTFLDEESEYSVPPKASRTRVAPMITDIATAGLFYGIGNEIGNLGR